MFNVRVITTGETLQEFSTKMTAFFHGEMQNQMNVLGEETHKFMQDEIRNNTNKRMGGTGKLIENIKYEFWTEAYKYGFSIGDIDLLNEKSKQWFWLNYGVAQTGRRTPPPNRGFFSNGIPPIGGQTGEKWTHTGNKKDYLLIPQKPLEPINYIENSISFLLAKLDILLAENPSNFRE